MSKYKTPDHQGNLPLHLAAFRSGKRRGYHKAKRIMKRDPSALWVRNHEGNLPIHCISPSLKGFWRVENRYGPECFKAMVLQDQRLLREADCFGNYPMHAMLISYASDIISWLLHLDSSLLWQRDVEGELPIQVAMDSNQYKLVEVMFAFDEKIIHELLENPTEIHRAAFWSPTLFKAKALHKKDILHVVNHEGKLPIQAARSAELREWMMQQDPNLKG